MFYTGTVTLPALYDHVAPETTVQAKSQMIVNKEGDVPDEDVPPVDPNNKIVNGGIGLPYDWTHCIGHYSLFLYR